MSEPVMTVRRAAALVRSGELGAEELARETLELIDRTEPDVHAYAHLDREAVLERARWADRERQAGSELGPLHGVPVAVKDVIATADLPTEAGSRILAGHVPAEDATVVRLLREAGATLVGKLVTHELACGADRPPTRNAWHLDRYPGGSSAGAGVAVATGTALAALGTDSGGSVRKPAALNGVSGLKPTYGRVSRRGVLPAGGSLDTVGVLARTADDCGLMLEVLGAPDQGDPAMAAGPRFQMMAAPDAMTGVRVGVDRSSLETPALDPELHAAFEHALEELAGLGATIVDVELPPYPLVEAAGFAIWLAEGAAWHRRWMAERPADYDPATRRSMQVGAFIPATDVDLAQRARRVISRDTAAVFRHSALDAFVSPTTPIRALAMAEMAAGDVGRYLKYLFPANLTGQPAISVPCGFAADGSPIGMQIAGAPMADDLVVAIATTYQQATNWHEARPAIVAATRH